MTASRRASKSWRYLLTTRFLSLVSNSSSSSSSSSSIVLVRESFKTIHSLTQKSTTNFVVFTIFPHFSEAENMFFLVFQPVICHAHGVLIISKCAFCWVFLHSRSHSVLNLANMIGWRSSSNSTDFYFFPNMFTVEKYWLLYQCLTVCLPVRRMFGRQRASEIIRHRSALPGAARTSLWGTCKWCDLKITI